ncbi:M23 family metallopeptidase [Amphiplicatus metriothermophilus]|uniref:Peptidase family M23 n=1 Tax=Amphiplicatus metriothermophilus TaxID=1519374 RepID=A0A239PTH0_9PROT|nr:M23 family metallopeptidase [Amphiplicatus metriothermophilus]MBB5519152.1 murein DD-endopeptidase MepM/ murein hydrolase activator NlpD [Amphiplicatus metriothermophilus]SNT73222.1 Peptidase family M23 [Amphiplicatus metriothermophilus]
MTETRDCGDLYEDWREPAPPPPIRDGARAYLAVGVAMLVMLAGAAFIAFIAFEAPEAAPQPAIAAPAAQSPKPAPEPAPQPTAQPLAVALAPAAPEPDAVVETRGRAPRLNPARAGEATDGEADAPTPALKPAADAADAAPAQRPITLGGAFLASAEDAPPPFFFADDLSPRRTPPPPLAAAYAGDATDGPRMVVVALKKGEAFVDALKRAGVRAEDRNAAAYAFGKHQNLRMLRPGQEFALRVAEPNRTIFQIATEGPGETHLLGLEYRPDPENRIVLARNAEGGFDAEKNFVNLTTRLVAVHGRIEGSLYLSAKAVGAPDEIIAGLADMFAYDVDFQREIFGGDEFEAIFEARYDERGELAGIGDILYGRLNWRGRTKEKGYYYFADYDGGKGGYFDRAGQSARRLLMKTPVDGARLSSGFGTRRHPILGYAKAHKGVDFAAPRGTPIKAAGDGVVERAGPYGGFGNYIRIRHANGYQTAYAHLHAIRRGVRAGARVRQGEIIGYVGSTGRSTGPHLHYEVHQNGKAVNPQTLKIATGETLKGAALEAFKAVRDRIDAMRLPPEPPSGLLARDDAEGKSAL